MLDQTKDVPELIQGDINFFMISFSPPFISDVRREALYGIIDIPISHRHQFRDVIALSWEQVKSGSKL